MIADKANNQKWYGNGKPDASQGGNPNGGVASETQGRRISPNFTRMTLSERWRNARKTTSGRGVEKREPDLRTNKERRCFYRNCICLIFR